MSGLHTLLKSARADIACSKKPHSKQMILKGANMMNKLISYFGTFTPGADGAVGAFQFEYLTSLGFAALVIFAGRAIVRRSHVLRKFAIPAPVISGLLFSVLIAIFKGTGILAISFDTNVSQRSAKHGQTPSVLLPASDMPTTNSSSGWTLNGKTGFYNSSIVYCQLLSEYVISCACVPLCYTGAFCFGCFGTNWCC